MSLPIRSADAYHLGQPDKYIHIVIKNDHLSAKVLPLQTLTTAQHLIDDIVPFPMMQQPPSVIRPGSATGSTSPEPASVLGAGLSSRPSTASSDAHAKVEEARPPHVPEGIHIRTATDGVPDGIRILPLLKLSTPNHS